MFNLIQRNADGLRDLARTAGVIEYGGRGAGWQGQVLPRGVKSQREMNAAGVGRTVWVMEKWSKGYSRMRVTQIVEKAIEGKRKLGKRQAALIEAMLEELGVDELGMNWHKMSADEKDSALDEIFGADSRPGSTPQSAPACQAASSGKAKKASPALAEPARPAQACKPEQHFPELDRQPEAVVIYGMEKNKAKLGRPPIQDGRNVVIRLQPQHIAKAKELGNGKIAAGVRRALGNH